MTITIETPLDVEQKVTQAADREGLSIEAYTLRALLTQAEAVPPVFPMLIVPIPGYSQPTIGNVSCS